MKNVIGLMLVLALPGAFIGYQVIAQSSGQSSGAADGQYGDLQQSLDRSLGGATQGQLSVSEVRESPLDGILEVVLSSGEVLFSDPSGQYLITGDMLQTSTDGFVNLSSQHRQRQNMELIANIPNEQTIRFTPDDVRASVTVFTDVDCTYCRQLHHDMEEILARGIEVRYAAFPRGGRQSDAYQKMVSVWCAEDQHRAMTQAKNGQNLPLRECENPVMEHFELGNRVGISGTPSIFLPDGNLVPGYLDVDRLAALALGQ